jgi:hypothetical protein
MGTRTMWLLLVVLAPLLLLEERQRAGRRRRRFLRRRPRPRCVGVSWIESTELIQLGWGESLGWFGRWVG